MLCFCQLENDGIQDPTCSTLCPSNLHPDKGSASYREVRLFMTIIEVVLVISDSDDSDDGDDGYADVDHGDHLTRYRE